MKHLCLIAETFTQYQTLTPLIKAIRGDESLYLSVISSDMQVTDEMAIHYFKIEQEGFVTDEDTRILFCDGRPAFHADFQENNQTRYDTFLKRHAPDMVILSGSSGRILQAAVTVSLNDIPIAHIQGGESGFGTWDDAYGFGITKLSHLHFTSSEKARQRVIRFGEHESTVVNAGSLLIENLRTLPPKSREAFAGEMGLKKDHGFLFIDLAPVTALGSQNRHLLEQVLAGIDDSVLKTCQLVFKLPEETGLGKMMATGIESFCVRHTGNAGCLPGGNPADTSHALDHCSAVVSNRTDTLAMAADKKKPAVHIKSPESKAIRGTGWIACRPDTADISSALKHALSRRSGQVSAGTSRDPGPSPSKIIKERIKCFTRPDMVSKQHYPLDL